MPIRNESSAVIDGLLRFAAVSGLTLTALLAPNALLLFDKPLQNYFRKLDKQQREREFKRYIAYMHRQGLVSGHYDHGLKITEKALKRLEKLDLDTLRIPLQKKWDGSWRIIFYDIPENLKTGRDQLGFRLRRLGCQQLQRSVWVFPYPCENEVNAVAVAYGLEKYITYIETTHINNGKALIKRFSAIKN